MARLVRTLCRALMFAALTACSSSAPIASAVPSATAQSSVAPIAASIATPTAALTSVAPPTAPRTSVAPSPSTQPSPAASGPLSAGAVPAAGVLLINNDHGVLRYDGSNGSLVAIGPERTGGFTLELALGAYFADPRCAGSCDPSVFIGWDGSTKPHGCRGSVSFAGACARIDGGALLVRATPDAAERTILPPDWGALVAEWDPAGRRILLLRAPSPDRRSVWLIEPDGRLRELLSSLATTFPGELTSLGWSPDGHFVDVRSSAPPLRGGLFESITVIDATTGAATSVVGGGAPRGEAAWAGDQLAVGLDAGVGQDWSRAIRIWTPTKVTDLTPPCPARAVAWNPIGTMIAWVEPDCATRAQFELWAGERLVLSDLAGRRTEVELPGQVIFGVRWSADGRSLLAAVSNAELRRGWELWLVDAEARAASRLVSGLEWPPYSDVAGRDELMPMTASGSPLGMVAWSRAVGP